jgi:hypothetical protein
VPTGGVTATTRPRTVCRKHAFATSAGRRPVASPPRPVLVLVSVGIGTSGAHTRVGLSIFLSVDPVLGGSCNNYDYTCQDPINRSDVDGQCSTSPPAYGPYGRCWGKQWVLTDWVASDTGGRTTISNNLEGQPLKSWSTKVNLWNLIGDLEEITVCFNSSCQTQDVVPYKLTPNVFTYTPGTSPDQSNNFGGSLTITITAEDIDPFSAFYGTTGGFGGNIEQDVPFYGYD